VESPSPDNDLFKHLARVYASVHPLMQSGNACPPEQFDGGITNGAQWYEVKGMWCTVYICMSIIKVEIVVTFVHIPSEQSNLVIMDEILSTGGMQDFNYIHSNCFEVTFELSCCKFPNASVLPMEWANNKESLLSFMEAAHMGVKGMMESNSLVVC
jgi:carboxypeptidase D